MKRSANVRQIAETWQPLSCLKAPVKAILCLVLSGPASALAAGPEFYNTGVDDNHQRLSGGSLDPHYQMRQVTVGAYTGNPNWTNAVVMDTSVTWGEWIRPNDARWIYVADAANLGQDWGTYEYRTTFDLTGYDPGTVVLTGKWAVDQSGPVYLNGNLVADLPDGNWNSHLNSFNLTSGFLPGTNTLTFRVRHPDGGDGIIVSEARLSASPLPKLAVISSAQQITVFWPASATNYVLESTTNLASPNWVTNLTAMTSNGTNYFYVTNLAGNLFFRLKRG